MRYTNPELNRALKAIRTAVADYMISEGCSCCERQDHAIHAAVLAKLLRVKKYKDKSGYDFHQHKTKKIPT